MDDKLKKVVSSIVKDFLNKYKRNPKDLKELAQFVLIQGGEKYIQRKTNEVLGKKLTQQEELTSEQKLKALHGAKLNYFKSLKNQCAEDEEVVYYKKGGSVTCGCKKKEDGDQINKASIGGVVERFKNRAKQKIEEAKAKVNAKKFKNDYSSKKVKQSQEDYEKGISDHEVNKCGGKMKKASRGAIAEFKKARCGSKLKKHLLGGSLNRIPFMQKGGNRVAPKAEVRYADSKKYTNGDGIVDANINYLKPTKVVYLNAPYLKYVPASISLVVSTPGDTIYTETPEVLRFARFGLFRPIPRKRSASTLNPNGLEYEILKRRFNTAWNLAK